MAAPRPDVALLRSLEPIGAFSSTRLEELSRLCVVESVPKAQDPFRGRGSAGEAVYLLRGELALISPSGGSMVVVGGSEEARHPLGRHGGPFSAAKTITDVELVCIDDDLMDLMATWDQIVEPARPPQAQEEVPSLANWAIVSGMFSVSNLKYGAFSRLPAANIEQLLNKFERIEVRAGEVVIREGAEGDYYYVIESGRCRVERMVGGVSMQLAELKSGDAFGEEALVSDAKRNASVTMKSGGALLRLGKREFVDLLREPLLQRVSYDEARQRAAMGGQWIDVRYPSEYQYDRLPGAINIPLAEIRNAFNVLDKERDYVVYCQSERRSSAAAFLLAQQGFKAYLLSGGLWNIERTA